MKEIIYNDLNIDDNKINKVVRRGKVIIENDNGDILLCSSNNNFFLPGGRCEKNESFEECLVREVLEETGIDIPLIKSNPILVIKHYWNDSTTGENTLAIANYYSYKCNSLPNLYKTNLTDEEITGDFNLHYINKSNILDFLNNSIKNASKHLVVQDTISAISTYLGSYMKFVNLLENDILLKEYIELCYFEWSSKKDLDLEKKYYNIKNNIGNKSIIIIGLVKDNVLVGFISLLEKDGEYEENISPWYATMYVKDKYRGLGYSKILNDELLRRSYELGYEKIYLKTDLINYYEKFGAVFIKSLNNGENLYYINTKR